MSTPSLPGSPAPLTFSSLSFLSLSNCVSLLSTFTLSPLLSSSVSLSTSSHLYGSPPSPLIFLLSLSTLLLSFSIHHLSRSRPFLLSPPHLPTCSSSSLSSVTTRHPSYLPLVPLRHLCLCLSSTFSLHLSSIIYSSLLLGVFPSRSYSSRLLSSTTSLSPCHLHHWSVLFPFLFLSYLFTVHSIFSSRHPRCISCAYTPPLLLLPLSLSPHPSRSHVVLSHFHFPSNPSVSFTCLLSLLLEYSSIPLGYHHLRPPRYQSPSPFSPYSTSYKYAQLTSYTHRRTLDPQTHSRAPESVFHLPPAYPLLRPTPLPLHNASPSTPNPHLSPPSLPYHDTTRHTHTPPLDPLCSLLSLFLPPSFSDSLSLSSTQIPPLSPPPLSSYRAPAALILLSPSPPRGLSSSTFYTLLSLSPLSLIAYPPLAYQLLSPLTTFLSPSPVSSPPLPHALSRSLSPPPLLPSLLPLYSVPLLSTSCSFQQHHYHTHTHTPHSLSILFSPCFTSDHALSRFLFSVSPPAPSLLSLSLFPSCLRPPRISHLAALIPKSHPLLHSPSLSLPPSPPSLPLPLSPHNSLLSFNHTNTTHTHDTSTTIPQPPLTYFSLSLHPSLCRIIYFYLSPSFPLSSLPPPPTL
ncbi:hypothetical protein C7M84_003202 [Penaeus vannamei]|uniref:Uncharacterized protein n=1 Tax=Penaeus vannamei TaxID=6689 RepID=A0A3R7QTR8_PENVA|nr:hypothetical protein C7M84_003202 [Penaeus vannamei]